jgi:hypothetical protein
MRNGSQVRIVPETEGNEDHKILWDDPHSTGIIIRESLWDDGYRSSGENGSADWWVVLRGDKLVHHPSDTFRKIV